MLLPGPGQQQPAQPGGTGWLAGAKLVEEVTHYPDWPTNDTVIAQWFGEFWLPEMTPSTPLPRVKRPSWLRNTDTYAWAHRWRSV